MLVRFPDPFCFSGIQFGCFLCHALILLCAMTCDHTCCIAAILIPDHSNVDLTNKAGFLGIQWRIDNDDPISECHATSYSKARCYASWHCQDIKEPCDLTCRLRQHVSK